MFALSPEAQRTIKHFAHQCEVLYFAQHALQPPPDALPVVPPAQGILKEPLGFFLNVLVGGKNTYTAGILLPKAPLHQSMSLIFQKAATALQPTRDKSLATTLKITSPPLPCQAPEEILSQHGIILFSRGRSHYLLPYTRAEQGLSTTGALEYLCRCMALPPGTWRDKTARILTFEIANV